VRERREEANKNPQGRLVRSMLNFMRGKRAQEKKTDFEIDEDEEGSSVPFIILVL
jgi:hypothetical protein